MTSTSSGPLLTNHILIGEDLLTQASGGTETHIYPATGQVNGQVTLGGEREIAAAVESAKKALVVWEALGPQERRDRLGRLAAILEDWSDEFKQLSAAETGMPQKGFIWRLKLSVEWVRTYQGFADRVGGELTSSRTTAPSRSSGPSPLAWSGSSSPGIRRFFLCA